MGSQLWSYPAPLPLEHVKNTKIGFLLERVFNYCYKMIKFALAAFQSDCSRHSQWDYDSSTVVTAASASDAFKLGYKCGRRLKQVPLQRTDLLSWLHNKITAVWRLAAITSVVQVKRGRCQRSVTDLIDNRSAEQKVQEGTWVVIWATVLTRAQPALLSVWVLHRVFLLRRFNWAPFY